MCSGYVLGGAFTALTGVTLPWFVSSMFIAAVLRNTTELPDEEFPDDEADKIGNVCLCGFLSMAMMSLKIWDLAELAGPLVVALALQTILLMVFSLFVVFPRLGRDYDAAVMTAGFIGFSMGATSNAMANMQAVSKKYGPSPTAFLVIPLVGGMAIDFVNIFVVSALIPVLGALA
jgi:ESS family glutamate:Na+ symporter